jgi:Ser/Thr protein kinase RdoA (MazF antagonist)
MELYAALMQQFVHYDQLESVEMIGNGNINDTYQVNVLQDGERRSLLLQRLNHHVFRQPDEVMNNIRLVADYLSRQPYPYRVAAPVPALDGTLLQQDEAGNYWRVFPFFEHCYVPEGITDPAVAYEAARAYGAFARALRDFPADQLAETIPGFHNTDQRWTYFLEVLAQNPMGRVETTQAEIKAMYEAKPVFDQISELKKSGALPLRVTHNDTKAGNVLMDESTGKAVSVIDWDTVMPGVILSDFGDMVRTFTPSCYEDDPAETLELRSAVLEALQTGFLAETADFITETEQNHLLLGGLWIIGEQALRFLSDYIAGDVYYKIKHPEHNLLRARNQIALFQALSKQIG